VAALIIIVIIIRLLLPKDCCKHFDRETKRRSDLYNDVRSGDLLGVAYTTIHGKLVKIFTGSMWTHLCLVIELYDDEVEVDPATGNVKLLDETVIKENGWKKDKRHPTKYIVEVARYSTIERGVIIKPLNRWMQWNDRRTISWRRYNGTIPFPVDTLKKYLRRTQHSRENMNVATWLRTMYLANYQRPSRDATYYCTEYISMLLQESSVLRKVYLPGSCQPYEMVYGKMKLEAGCHYAKPYLYEVD
jgi:Fe-S-cluster formation regulator IscX/YfhJ